ncbi:MAG: glucose 1-dehydrogenase [Nitrososphaerota archaeon]|nr:glucose 1-dehydrogenase [Nitrososphaerota archaeon]MDG6955628.1 glucose 1-dehydrogenase [Nitrososphaerota archaeon]
MKAITVVPGSSNSLSLREAPDPSPKRGELLLRVHRVGVCGTDMDIISGFYGEAPAGSPYLTIGHESLSRVERVGPGSRGFEAGDLVVPTVRRNCPENCLNCRSGESDMCLTGHYSEHGIKGLHGFASELAVTDSRFVVKLPEALSEVGVLLEPLTIVEKGLNQAFGMQAGRMKWKPQNALVLGAGPVGLLATALLRMKGLKVTAVARKPPGSLKATLAASTGAAYVDVGDVPLSSMEDRFDVVLEATGSAAVALEAQNLSGTNGVVSYIGIYRSQVGTEDAGKVFTNLVLGNRVYFGSVNANISYFREGAADLVRIKRRFPGFLERLITDKVPLSRWDDAYSAKGGDSVKTVLQLHQDGH